MSKLWGNGSLYFTCFLENYVPGGGVFSSTLTPNNCPMWHIEIVEGKQLPLTQKLRLVTLNTFVKADPLPYRDPPRTESGTCSALLGWVWHSSRDSSGQNLVLALPTQWPSSPLPVKTLYMTLSRWWTWHTSPPGSGCVPNSPLGLSTLKLFLPSFLHPSILNNAFPSDLLLFLVIFNADFPLWLLIEATVTCMWDLDMEMLFNE